MQTRQVCARRRPFLIRSAPSGGDATAMMKHRADKIVARFRGTERGMGGERDVFQRGQDVARRQGLDGEDIEARMAGMARAQRLEEFLIPILRIRTAKPSLPTGPASMDELTTRSNTRRKISLSRKRSLRAREKAEWSGIASSKPRSQTSD